MVTLTSFDYELLALAATDALKADGGFTLCLDGHSPEYSADDFVVSLYGSEERLQRPPSIVYFEGFVSRNWHSLQLPRHYVGGERRHHYFFLDVSLVVSGLPEAMRFALINDQERIYHPATSKTIEVRPRRDVLEHYLSLRLERLR